MQPVIPVVATIISVVVGYEHLSVVKVLGILCAVGGAILVETWHTGGNDDDGDDDDDSSNMLLGTILVCVQVSGMAALIVFQKKLLKKYDPTVLTFAYYSTGSGKDCSRD
jgi:drug/metabolite transporter (DMT)-like permease